MLVNNPLNSLIFRSVSFIWRSVSFWERAKRSTICWSYAVDMAATCHPRHLVSRRGGLVPSPVIATDGFLQPI
jgi:hypothetical protein